MPKKQTAERRRKVAAADTNNVVYSPEGLLNSHTDTHWPQNSQHAKGLEEDR
jgi:hypothetical protein